MAGPHLPKIRTTIIKTIKQYSTSYVKSTHSEEFWINEDCRTEGVIVGRDGPVLV